MKWFLNALLAILPLVSFSQSDESPLKLNNGIGINLTSSERDGLGMTFRYTYQLENRGKLKFEINSNFSDSYFGRMGYEFLLLQKNKFEIGIGLDLKFQYNDYSRFGQLNLRKLDLELPIEFRYQFAPNYNIMAGISLSRNLSSSYRVINEKSLSEYRIGIGYQF